MPYGTYAAVVGTAGSCSYIIRDSASKLDARGQADAARNERGTVNRHDPQPRTRCPAEWSAFGPARCGKRIRSAPGLR